jgi:peptidoglycan/LPS O-acetylase OafA/YrhL
MRWSKRQVDPFRSLPLLFFFVAMTCLALRAHAVSRLSESDLQNWNVYNSVYIPTHHRLDALFLGVLLGYVYHFRSDLLDRLFGSRSIVVSSALLSVGFISLAGLLPQRSKFMLTVGITALYLGFGIVLMLSLRIRGILPNVLTEPFVKIGNVAASVGRYSYSIYLWHWPVRSWGFALFHKVFHRPLASIFGFAVYMSLSIFVGVLLSRLVEYPVLALRDRAFPSFGSETKIR